MQAKVRKLYDKYQFVFVSPGKSCRERTRLTWKCILHCWCIYCNKDWFVVLILRRGKKNYAWNFEKGQCLKRSIIIISHENEKMRLAFRNFLLGNCWPSRVVFHCKWLMIFAVEECVSCPPCLHWSIVFKINTLFLFKAHMRSAQNAQGSTSFNKCYQIYITQKY